MADRMPAQDKLAFLLALVPYLIDNGRVSVTQAAEHFQVSEALVRESVRLIAVSGIPGETASYQHGDLFDIAWDDFEERDLITLTNLVAIDDSPRFSAREAAALIAGLQYLSSLPENADRSAISSLMAKLTRGASAEPSQVAVAESGTDDAISLIRTALDSGTQVEFAYRNSQGHEERRRVDPLRIESVDQDWYLRGWCHLREAVRTFRLDRMIDVMCTGDPIERRAEEVALPETLFESSTDDLLVDIELPVSAVPLIADYIPDGAIAETRDGLARTRVRVAHYHGLKRLVNRMSGVISVLGPPEARAAVAEWAEAGASRYEAP